MTKSETAKPGSAAERHVEWERRLFDIASQLDEIANEMVAQGYNNWPVLAGLGAGLTRDRMIHAARSLVRRLARDVRWQR